MRTIVKALSTLATKLVAGSLSGLHTDPDGNLWVAGFDILAHLPSAPAAYFTSRTLPASGNATDPSAGTPGTGLAIPVPTWAINATIFITYVLGAGGNVNAGAATATVWLGPAVGAPLSAMFPIVGSGSVDVGGAVLLAAGIAGAGTIGLRLLESGDTAHPGTVTIKVVFTR